MVHDPPPRGRVDLVVDLGYDRAITRARLARMGFSVLHWPEFSSRILESLEAVLPRGAGRDGEAEGHTARDEPPRLASLPGPKDLRTNRTMPVQFAVLASGSK